MVQKTKNIQWAAVLGNKALLMSELSEEKGQTCSSWQEGDSNANNTHYNSGMQKSIWTHNMLNFWSGWATAAEDQ